jgi:pilus assembly protein CpaB
MDVGAYQQITAEMVELVETSDTMFAPAHDRITSLEDVIGRVAAKPLPQHSPILLSMLAPSGTPPGMVGRIPPGYRAVSVRIDEVTGVAYQVKPGDYVDVIVVMDVDTGSGARRRETIAEVILQNVQVAAIGQDSSGPSSGGGKVKPAKSATLMVAEEDVPKLHLAATRGKITLAMRGDEDATPSLAGYARDSDVFAALRDTTDAEETEVKPRIAISPEVKPVEPEPEPEPPYSVLVCRGSTQPNVPPVVGRITFENASSPNIIATSDGPASRKAQTLSAGQKRQSRVPTKERTDVPPPAREVSQPDDEDVDDN